MKSPLLIFLLFSSVLFSQEFEIGGSIGTKVILTNENETPFWFHTNTNYAVGELTNLSATAGLKASLTYSKFKLNVGAAVYGRDGVAHNVQRRDLYLQFENSWLLATVGSK